MNKTTKIIIVAIIAFIAGGLYFAYHSYDDCSIGYDYEWDVIPYYYDTDGVHYPSQGNKFVNAYITEVNTGKGKVLAFPNCYSLLTEDGNRYEWITGTTDRGELYGGEVAHIITTFEIPKSVNKVAIVWNLVSVNATLVEL